MIMNNITHQTSLSLEDLEEINWVCYLFRWKEAKDSKFQCNLTIQLQTENRTKTGKRTKRKKQTNTR